MGEAKRGNGGIHLRWGGESFPFRLGGYEAIGYSAVMVLLKHQ